MAGKAVKLSHSTDPDRISKDPGARGLRDQAIVTTRNQAGEQQKIKGIAAATARDGALILTDTAASEIIQQNPPNYAPHV
jgi:hypothetical protein